jgi:hypothetical protein
MSNPSKLNSVIFIGCALFLLACANKKPAPQIASSAKSPGYAAEYPETLNGQVVEYKSGVAASKEKTAAFSAYPDVLTEPDWHQVLTVLEAADREGRGQAYADRMVETEMARRFFEREKDDITRRINGAVVNGAEKAGCNCELEAYGKISWALKDTVDRKLEERLLEPSEAYQLIERNEKAIGKKNIEPLKTQAADIALTAHIVYVLLPTTYQELERRGAEAKAVKATLEDEIEREQAASQEKGLSKKEKKAAEKRIGELQKALSAVDGKKSEAEQIVAKAEIDLPALQDKYDKAFDALTDKVKSKIKK